MNYVNKDNAIGLKEIGFQEQCFAFFMERGDGMIGDHYNCWELCTVSRPDFLTAADWFFPNHSIEIIFSVYRTKLFSHITGEYIGVFGAGDTDHRNAALAAAIKMVKEKQL